MEYEKAKKEELVFSEEKSSSYKLYKYKTINQIQIGEKIIDVQVVTDKICDQDEMNVPDYAIVEECGKGVVMLLTPEFVNLPDHVMPLFLNHCMICLGLLFNSGYNTTTDKGIDYEFMVNIEKLADLELVRNHGLESVKEFLEYLYKTYPNTEMFGLRLLSINER